MATLEERAAGGVSFGLTNEQRALRELAHDFAEREIRPKERAYDEHSTHPADVIARAHELGLMNVHIPEAYGGLELGAFEGMIIGLVLEAYVARGLGGAVMNAAAATGAVTLGAGAYGYTTKRDLSGMGGISKTMLRELAHMPWYRTVAVVDVREEALALAGTTLGLPATALFA